MITDPIGSVQTLTESIETPWGTYAPGCLVTIHAGTETGWIIDLDPLPTLGQQHRIEIPASAVTIWHTPIRVVEQPMPDTVTVPVRILAELYLTASIDAQVRADSHLGPGLVDAVVDRHDRKVGLR